MVAASVACETTFVPAASMIFVDVEIERTADPGESSTRNKPLMLLLTANPGEGAITPAALLFVTYENITTVWPATHEIVALGPTTNGPLCAGIVVGPFSLMPLQPVATSFQVALTLKLRANGLPFKAIDSATVTIATVEDAFSRVIAEVPFTFCVLPDAVADFTTAA